MEATETNKFNEWICLISLPNQNGFLVTKTKFLRNPGDIMNINGKKYKVISTEGDRNCMISVMNHHINLFNSGKRFNY